MIVSAPQLARLVGGEPFRSPAYRDLTDRIRLLVVDGRLVDGARLPSERELAAALGVSRTTTARVYAELRDAGLLTSRQGSGSVVHVPLAASSVSSLIIDPGTPGDIALTYSAPVAPPGLAAAFQAATEQLPGLLATTGYLPDGLPALRGAIARRYEERGLPTDPEQIVVTNGAMGAISLIGRTFLRPGSRVVVEGATYPHAVDAFVASGARAVPLPLTSTPWDPDALASTVRRGSVTAAYLIPEFHNPTGAVMSAEERRGWARLLRQHEILPIVDESLRELNLDDVDLPASYAALDGRAVLIGSASKTFWGGLRVGWARIPHGQVVSVLQQRMTLDLGTSAFEQAVVTELLRDGAAARAHRLTTAREARDHLLAEVNRRLPHVQVDSPAGGLNLWLTLPGRDSSALTASAARHGLLLTPGPRFFPGAGGERHLRLPYTLPLEALTEAVERLATAYAAIGDDRVPGTMSPIDLIA